MSWLRRIAEGFREFEHDWATAFGLTPLHDVDVPDEPPAVVDWDAIRDGINEVRDSLLEVLDWLDRIDPTPMGLATATSVTNLNARRP